MQVEQFVAESFLKTLDDTLQELLDVGSFPLYLNESTFLCSPQDGCYIMLVVFSPSS